MPCEIEYDSDGFPYCIKDPDAVLDYKVDLAPLTNGRDGAESDWLASGETVTSQTVTPDTGLTLDSSSITDSATSITAWLSGGAVVDDVYDVRVHFVTSAGREDDRTFRIVMQER